MKRAVVLIGAVLVLVLAITPIAFASNGNGPEAHDICPKDLMDPADVARFEEIIEDYKTAMTRLRGDKDSFEERVQLKEAKRNDLLEIVPDGFEGRFGNFNKNQGMKTQGRRNKSG
ncbi:MAG: hypothetical protein ACQES4_07770 [Bacillota bacterium]